MPQFRRDFFSKKRGRDNDAVQSILLLVDLREIPLTAIQGWTDEQCLLATDWAGSVHLNASDNLSRVPAMPEFLKAYRK
jgi:hypothetical protein